MNKYLVEFALTGEGSIFAKSEQEAHDVIKKVLKKSASVIGDELAENSELVHVSARHVHTLRIIKQAKTRSCDPTA